MHFKEICRNISYTFYEWRVKGSIYEYLNNKTLSIPVGCTQIAIECTFSCCNYRVRCSLQSILNLRYRIQNHWRLIPLECNWNQCHENKNELNSQSVTFIRSMLTIKNGSLQLIHSNYQFHRNVNLKMEREKKNTHKVCKQRIIVDKQQFDIQSKRETKKKNIPFKTHSTTRISLDTSTKQTNLCLFSIWSVRSNQTKPKHAYSCSIRTYRFVHTQTNQKYWTTEWKR